MDVYLIPIAPERYELYCEAPGDPPSAGQPAHGFVSRWRERFGDMLRAAEERRQTGHSRAASASWRERTQDRILAWVAERIAEQRLLWNLQKETAVTLLHPDDLARAEAQALVGRILQRDYERHRRWMIFDGVAFVFTFVVLGPLFLLLPGIANLPALYFGFRVVGHWFSMRGARQGRHRVTWTPLPSPRLTELRGLLDVEAPARAARLREIAAHLRLEHLATFFDRVAVHHA